VTAAAELGDEAVAAVTGPQLLRAQAKVVSASAKIMAPWQMPCPLTRARYFPNVRSIIRRAWGIVGKGR
jgi:hypothetical protein